MTNPLDAYLEEREKVAGPGAFSGIGRGVRSGMSMHGIGMLGAHSALTMAAIGGVDAVKKIHTAITKKRDFDKMMDANPDLEEFQRENAKQFNQHYSSLRSMNPTFGSEPVIAGTYMRQMSMAPATAGKVVVESLGGLPAGGGMRDYMQGAQYVQKGLTPPSEKDRVQTEELRGKMKREAGTRGFDYTTQQQKAQEASGKMKAERDVQKQREMWSS